MLFKFIRKAQPSPPSKRYPDDFRTQASAIPTLSMSDVEKLCETYEGMTKALDQSLAILEGAAMTFQANGRTAALAAIKPTLIELSAFRYSKVTRDLREASRQRI